MMGDAVRKYPGACELFAARKYKLITDSGDRKNQGRPMRCFFQFLADSTDVRIHGPSESISIVSPHRSQEFIPGDHAPCSFDEITKKLKLATS